MRWGDKGNDTGSDQGRSSGSEGIHSRDSLPEDVQGSGTQNMFPCSRGGQIVVE